MAAIAHPAERAAVRAPVRRKVGWQRHRRWVLPVAGLFVALAFLWPYLVMLLNSLRPSSDVVQTPADHPAAPGSCHVRPGARRRAVPGLAADLRARGGHSTLIVILVSIPAAYFTARFRFPGRIAFLFLVLVTQMFSPTSLVVGLYREFFNLNLVNTYLALILTNAAFNLAFAVWILHGFFSSIPKEVEEAAHLDGCGRLRTLLRIMLPLTLPGVVDRDRLHLHRRVERVRRRADPDDRRGQEAADGRHHVVRHGVRAALGPAVRRVDHRRSCRS